MPVARAFAVGDRVEARWNAEWWPGVVDELLVGGSYEIKWSTGESNPVPGDDVRAPRAVVG